jgi:hypothetical protein
MTAIKAAKERVGIAQIGAMLFPEWRPGRSCKCPWREDRKPSFSVSACGRLWNDFASGDAGDAIDFLAKAKGLSLQDAAKEFLRIAGGRAGEMKPLPPPPERKPWSPEPMPEAVRSMWDDGHTCLLNSPGLLRNLSSWRGWPIDFALKLTEVGLVGVPKLWGDRDIAWRVDAFPMIQGRRQVLPVGFHARKAGKEGERASWRFMPTEKAHGRGIPSLPVVFGEIERAGLIVVCEGQWDAASLLVAAGWSPQEIPPGVAVVGIRGAQGVRPFIEHYAAIWPEHVRFMLLPDADEAGRSWFEDREGRASFLSKLKPLCGRVVAVKLCGAGKDLNDMLKAGELNRHSLRELFTGAGFAREGRELFT